jgi:hypothetical protein
MTAFNVPANLAFDSYDELISTINDWMDRSDLTGAAPSMIALCEARIRRELDPLTFETSASVAVSEGIGPLPADYDFMRSVSYNGKPLDECSPEIGRQFAAGETPVAYSLEAGQMRVWPAWTGTVVILYQAKMPALSEANQSNTILLQHPDVYFFGSMLFAEGYLANDSRAAVFKALWDEALDSAKRYYLRQRRDRPRLRNPAIVV